jgi:hypothetical protein
VDRFAELLDNGPFGSQLSKFGDSTQKTCLAHFECNRDFSTVTAITGIDLANLFFAGAHGQQTDFERQFLRFIMQSLTFFLC